MQRRSEGDKGRVRMKRGDVEALGALYDAHARQLYAYARMLGASEALAEDILQEVFLRLSRRPPRRAIENPRAFLYAVTRNEFYRWGARILRRKEVSANGAAGVLDAVAAGSTAEEAAAAAEALSKLPRTQREVVMMKVYGRLTFEEIAEVMETGANTAASRYRYAVEKLRAMLREP